MRFAGDVNIGSFMSDTPAYDRVGSMAVGEDAENDVSQAMRNAYVADAGMRAQGAIARAEANADAIRAGGDAKYQSSLVGAVAGGLEGQFRKLGSAFRGGSGISGTQALFSGASMARGLM